MDNNKYKFKKLTPAKDADISVYEEAFDYVFNDDDIKNVAISGAYSAGKSSILESYKSHHSNINFLHISLVQFRLSEQKHSTTNVLEIYQPKEGVNESVLEGKILNQLIHQIPANLIPLTNFRVKKDINNKNLFWPTVIASVFIGVLLYFLFLNNISQTIISLSNEWIKGLLISLTSPYVKLITAFIGFIIMIYINFSVIKAQKSKNLFRKITLQGNEIEIFEETEDSYFDKYLNEVLYLFEKVEADVIVFEDMDRFNACRIFERLREVNTLVNMHRSKESPRATKTLKFFYLLRDDIFDSKDRTKFFDFIIPVIPIVDGSNSYEKFIQFLKDADILDKFDPSFLQKLSLYVDDMRILKNIYNEFTIYLNRLNVTELDYNKMLAIITYKNLFPCDFNNLQLAKGYVKRVFAEKEHIIADNIKLAESNLSNLCQRINRAHREVLKSEEELTDAFETKKKRIQREKGIYNCAEEIREIMSELDGRKQSLQDKNEKMLQELQEEISVLEEDISTMKTKSLKELITRENSEAVFSIKYKNEIGDENDFKEVKMSDYFDLLKFLIRDGYIDETYSDYMTYFYDGSLSTTDKIFLRRITDKKGADFNYKLKDPQKIIKSPVLRRVDFENEETLNFDLFDWLLENDNLVENKTYLETLVRQMKTTENFDFVLEYYKSTKFSYKYVDLINRCWVDHFYDVITYNKILPEYVRKFSLDTISYCDEEIIVATNIENCLSKYISVTPNYLEINEPRVDKLINGFIRIGVLFSSIAYNSANKALFDEVYERSLYKLNFENISWILKFKCLIESEEDIIHRNYSLVIQNMDSPIAEYISKNISKYMRIIIDSSEEWINDDEEAAICLLNNEELDSGLKLEYIKLLTIKIDDLSKIADHSLWNDILDQDILKFSLCNFIYYFDEFDLNEKLIEFLNSSIDDFDFSHAEANFESKVLERLFDKVSVCNDIETEKYRNILNELDYCFENYNAIEISDEKFKVLIEEDILQLNSDSLKYVRENYFNHLYDFIRHNLDNYIEIQTPDIMNLVEVIGILNWKIQEETKLKLLAKTNGSISVINTDFSDLIMSHILNNNLDVQDKPELFKNYSSYGNQTQTSIEKIAVASIKELLDWNFNIDDTLSSRMFQSDELSREYKIKLFVVSIPTFDTDACSKHLKELGYEDLSLIFTKGGSRRKFEKNNEVKAILDAFKTHNFIYDYCEDEGNDGKYLIKKNPPKN